MYINVSFVIAGGKESIWEQVGNLMSEQFRIEVDESPRAKSASDESFARSRKCSGRKNKQGV